jgi:hypothetical protein
MNYRFRFKLRTLLVATSLLAVVLGLAVNHWTRSVAQRNAVRWLEAYGDKFRDRPGSMTDVYVYYDDELSWREEESRFVRDLPWQDLKWYGWVRETVGRDFVDSPIAVEISCNDYDLESGKYVSTFDQTLIDGIKQLSTIRQLWVITVSADGKQVNVYTNDDLKKHFPNMIFSNIAE